MLSKFGVRFLALVVLALTGVEVVSAGFFDELVEEGKKKLKDEADKVLKSGQGQPPSPKNSQPAGRSQSSSSTPMSAGPDTITEIGPPVLRKIQGQIVYDISQGYMQQQNEQFNKMKRWFDYLFLGMAPDIFDKNPECFLKQHVPASEWTEYVEENKIKALETARRMNPDVGYMINKEDWKGQNEFEKNRSRKAFIENYRDKFRGAALQMPIQLVFVYQENLKYNFESQGFPLLASRNPTDELQSMCGGYLKASVTPYIVMDKEFLQQGQDRQRGQRLWAINPDEAEKLLSRLERIDGGSVGTMARAYWGIVAEYQAVPETQAKQVIRKHGEGHISVALPAVRAIVNSVGLYEDPDLERPIRKLTITQPAESVMLTGVPEALPQLDQVPPVGQVMQTDMPEAVQKNDQMLLDDEAVSLLSLKYYGDVLSKEGWEVLAQKQIEHDRNYYTYGKPDPTEMEKRDRSLKSGKEPNPKYVPFTPPQFSGAIDAKQMIRFKQWTLARAASLSDTLTLKGGFGIYGNGTERALRAEFSSPYVGKSNWDRELLASIAQLGHAREQVLTFYDRVRPYAIIFPSPVKALNPKLSQSQEADFTRASAGMYSEVEIDLMVKKPQLINAGTREKAVVIYGTPSQYRVILNSNSERVIWKESTYQVGSLDSNRITSAQSVAPASPVQVPYSASTGNTVSNANARPISGERSLNQYEEIAICLALVYLSNDDAQKYTNPETWGVVIQSIKTRAGGLNTYHAFSQAPNFWKGTSEFEVRRNKQAFLSDYLGQFKEFSDERRNCVTPGTKPAVIR